MQDRREEILNEKLGPDFISTTPDIDVIALKDAMDEYMKESVLLAFEFVAHETAGHSMNETTNELEFKYKGEWISREQLFENFL